MRIIRAVMDRVVVKRTKLKEETEAGILLPEGVMEKAFRGHVVSIGPGKLATTTGELVPTKLKMGDLVFFDRYGGVEVTLDGCDFLIFREHEIMGVIEWADTKDGW